MVEIDLKRMPEERVAPELGNKGEDISAMALGEPEPWENWETQLCLWSIGIGMTALLVLGILINQLLLS